MYRLIVVDDEEIIREGLMYGVNWEPLGFEVAAGFEDGADALEWLDRNGCDVVLTDIMMARMSGLELAQKVYESHPEVRVLILSAYQEFEYARTAIRWGVVDYLLKPIRTQEIRQVFSRLRDTLDRESDEASSFTDGQRRELLELAQTHFFRTLLSGQIASGTELEQGLKLLGLSPELADRPVVLYSAGRREKGEDEVRTGDAIGRALTRLGETAFCIPSEGDTCTVLEIPEENAESHIREELGEDFEVCRISELMSMRSLVGRARQEQRDALTLDTAERLGEAVSLALMSRYRLFVLRLNNDDRSGLAELFAAYLHELEHFLDPQTQLGYLRFMVKSLLSGIAADYSRQNIDVRALTGGHYNSMKVLEAADLESLHETGLLMLEHLRRGLHRKDDEAAPNFMIQRIEQYIHENLAGDVSAEKLARIAHMNPTYFGRYFKKNTGEFVGDYILRLRIERAVELLREGKHKTSDIASQVGFSTPKYFYFQFKKATGYTTTEYCRYVLAEEKKR